jgi:hypothetical protein
MISIFAQPPREVRGHMQRVSSIIRGEQIAAYLGNARLNPPSGYEDDVCIYVKPHVGHSGADYKFEKHSWVDIHDGFQLRHTLRKYPEVGCISISNHSTYVLRQYIKNKIVTIPHHHLNFERAKRTDRRANVTRIGVTGSPVAFSFIPESLREGLKARGIQLMEWSHFYPRTSVARFHQNIDIHLEWRPWRKQLSSPLKITNAASFGVPTIALMYDEPSFGEVENCFIGVNSPEECLEQIDKLRNSDTTPTNMYKEIADICLEKAEYYHIDNISKLYYELT